MNAKLSRRSQVAGRRVALLGRRSQDAGCRLEVVGCRQRRGKKGGILIEVVVHIILIALILAVFVSASAERVNGRDVRQQVLEKQIALLIDSAEAGMRFEIFKMNVNGLVDDVKVRDGRVYVGVDGFPSVRGYPYFSRYSVEVDKGKDKFVVFIKK